MFTRLIMGLAVMCLAGFAAWATAASAGGNSLGDVGCDGRVNSLDALAILQFDAGIISDLPCETGPAIQEEEAVTLVMDWLISQGASYDSIGRVHVPNGILSIQKITITPSRCSGDWSDGVWDVNCPTSLGAAAPRCFRVFETTFSVTRVGC